MAVTELQEAEFAPGARVLIEAQVSRDPSDPDQTTVRVVLPSSLIVELPVAWLTPKPPDEPLEEAKKDLLGKWRTAMHAHMSGTPEEQEVYDREARKAEQRFMALYPWARPEQRAAIQKIAADELEVIAKQMRDEHEQLAEIRRIAQESAKGPRADAWRAIQTILQVLDPEDAA